MKRRSTGGAECPVARALDIVGDWWTLLIVRDAFDGMCRFGEFQRSLGISKGILAGRLKALVELGIMEAVAPRSGEAHNDYRLTPKGRALFPVIVGLRQWGEAHCFAPGEARSVLVEKDTGREVARLRLEGKSGRQIDDRDTEVRKVGSSL